MMCKQALCEWHRAEPAEGQEFIAGSRGILRRGICEKQLLPAPTEVRSHSELEAPALHISKILGIHSILPV